MGACTFRFRGKAGFQADAGIWPGFAGPLAGYGVRVRSRCADYHGPGIRGSPGGAAHRTSVVVRVSVNAAYRCPDALGAAGAIVVGTATTDNGAAAISAHFESQGFQGEGMALNVTSADAVNETIKAITEKYGAPQILINNADITRDNLLI